MAAVHHATPRTKAIPAGAVFGRLVVLRRGGVDGSRHRFWVCRCSCGVEREVRATDLRGGVTVSCGCAAQEQLGPRSTIHGMSASSTYQSWQAMRKRCGERAGAGGKYYRDAGIAVCERWTLFEAFLADMGERPEGTSLDRIDGTKGYAPDNCRWATPGEQARNRRSTVLTPAVVASIRARVAGGEQSWKVAADLGLNPHTVDNAARGVTWA